MDITSFLDDNFDTKVWVNKVLKSEEFSDKKENQTMSAVMKLQLYVQQVNNALEDTGQQVLASLPKIMRDTKSLQEEAKILKEKMVVVKKEILKIEEDTGNFIKTIEKLDNMKSKLTEAKQGLHESDNWTVLVNNLEEVFDSKNVEAMSAKILSMQQSLKLLVNVSDYDDRKLQLEGLKNRLEAISSPSIVQAFTTNNTEQSVMFTRVFKSMGRLPQLIKYFHKCQKDALIKKWRSLLELEQEESVAQWIHNYFDYLLSNWHTQYKWFNQVFPEEPATSYLVDVYMDVLNCLDPSMQECIDAALKQSPDKLALLYETKQIIQQFASNLMVVIGNNWQDKDKKVKLLLQSIYNPLVTYISKYAAYEQAYLLQKLTSVNCLKEDLVDTIQALGLSISNIFDIAFASKKRCIDLSEYCGYSGLLIALRAYFINYADQYRVALRQIDRNKSKKEDWNSFQLCLSLMQYCGDVLNNLQSLEKELTNSILDIKDVEYYVEYKYLLLDDSERKEFECLVKCVTDGTQLSLLDNVITEFSKLCGDVHNTTYQVVFAPIASQLDTIVSTRMWVQFTDSSAHQMDLPDYSYSPQEYITQIGLYLMTLPQHLEPFLFRDNPSLNCALKSANEEYLQTEEVEGAMAHVFLALVARGTCNGYCDRILSICELSHSASKQLAHDVAYLGNVLDDLGLTLSENLQQLIKLLKLPADQYQSQSSGCTARLVATIRQMRNIPSSGF